MEPRRNTEELNTEPQKEALKRYLNQHFRAKKRKHQLEMRLADFKSDIGGAKAIQYSPTPMSGTFKGGSYQEQRAVRESEIVESIEEQKAVCSQTMAKVMSLMDVLPQDSTERMILEYRHIDCLGWSRICREMNYSRSTANDYYNRGLEKMLESKKVQNAIQDFIRI